MEATRPSHESRAQAASEDSHSDHGAEKTAAQKDSQQNRPWFRRRTAVIAIILSCVVVLALGLGLGLGLGLNKSSGSANHKQPGQTAKPNVLLVMTDDQDMLLDSMSVMPNVNRLIGDQGVRYNKHYCTVAWCCPSRVNFFTGRASHNTNVTSTVPPYGGWYKFAEQGLNNNYLPVWINETGINTYYVGKFLNSYGEGNFHHPAYPKGWTEQEMLVDPYTYNYYHSVWTSGENPGLTKYPGIHTTDVTQAKALAMLDHAAESGNQFFMMVTPVAPHQELYDGTFPPPVPKQWQGVFANRTAPRTENFNPEVPSGASWVYGAPRLNSTQLQLCDTTYNHRLGNVAAVDVMMSELIQRLDDHGILDNTYVIYTTDNGFHIGNHRLLPGKRCPYEEDVNIPLLIRGPGVAQNVNSSIANSHTDMAPTILQMLGVPLRSEFDGAPIAYTADAIASSNKTEIVSVEFWDGAAGAPIGVSSHLYYNNTYKALRIMTGGYSLYYSTWCTGEREFYDMQTDSQQMNNLLGSDPKVDTSITYYGRPQSQLVSRMDAVLMVTKSCKMESCRNPWGVMFPAGEVTSLEQALDSQYDAFFQNQPKVQFESCAAGFIADRETPFYLDEFGTGQQVFPGSVRG